MTEEEINKQTEIFLKDAVHNFSFEYLCRIYIRECLKNDELKKKIVDKFDVFAGEDEDLIVVSKDKLKAVLKANLCTSCICRNYCFKTGMSSHSCERVKMAYLNGKINMNEYDG